MRKGDRRPFRAIAGELAKLGHIDPGGRPYHAGSSIRCYIPSISVAHSRPGLTGMFSTVREEG
jgi:hypothetical protein